MIKSFFKLPPLRMRWRWLNWPASLRRAVTLAFFALMNWVLLAPASTFRDVHLFLSHQDKLAHLGIFGILTGLVRWSIPSVWGKGKMRFVLILALVAYGAAIECMQPLMPNAGRTFEWGDLLLDGVGVILGVLVCEILARKE